MDPALLATSVAVFGAVLLLAIHLVSRWRLMPSIRRRYHDWRIDLFENKGPKNYQGGAGPDRPRRPRDEPVWQWNQAPSGYAPDRRRFWVQVFVTAVVLLAAIYVLVFKPEAETSLKDFCYTSVGTIIGFWLKA